MDKNDEKVLVVKSEKLFENGIWQGLKRDNLEYYLDLINKNFEFKRRGDVEEDNNYQQIIPYILFSYEGKFFAYKYLSGAGEKRLVNNNYQLGVGGHINKEDVADERNIIEAGMMREWNEEVEFAGSLLSKKLVGIINDDSSPVEKVHLGLVFHFIGDASDINVKETDKMEGKIFELKEIENNLSHSPWMKIVYNDYLKNLV